MFKQLFLFGFFTWLNFSNAHSQSYQVSIFYGMRASIGYSTLMWSSEQVNPKMTLSHGIKASLGYGIGESFGLYASYLKSINTNANGVEIDFLLFSKKARHDLSEVGISFYPGNGSKKIRLGVSLGALLNKTTLTLLDDKNDLSTNLFLDGIGIHPSFNLHYFPKPFFSIQILGGYTYGVYKRSNYFGISYKEANVFSYIDAALTFNYHFGGR